LEAYANGTPAPTILPKEVDIAHADSGHENRKSQRKDGQGKDTFDISDWWKANCAKLPAVNE
jgi:hypothetical protein